MKNFYLFCSITIIIYIYINSITYTNPFNEYLYFDIYIYSTNHNKFLNKMKYIPRRSCGLGNKLLGLISSIAYGFANSYALKVLEWDSLWWYFTFPLKLDKHKYLYNVTFTGHFYAIKTVIDNISTRKHLIESGVIEYNSNSNIMVNSLAYKISYYFLQISEIIKSKIESKYMTNIQYGIHLRTGKADGQEYLLHYLKYDDIVSIFKFINTIKNNKSIYISSDSVNIKLKYKKMINNLYYINSSTCNSGFGLLKKNNKCAIEAIIDYFLLSRCDYLILTRCSSFSLISLFANRIGYKTKTMYRFYGNCTIHSDLFS